MTKKSENENVLMQRHEKEALKADQGTSANSTIHRMRWRVRERSESLVDEIELLYDQDHVDLVDDLLRELKNTDFVLDQQIEDRVAIIEHQIREIERASDQVPSIREELKELKTDLDMA